MEGPNDGMRTRDFCIDTVFLTVLALMLVGYLSAQRSPQDIQSLQQTNEIVVTGTVSSVLRTNYHYVELWTNETVKTAAAFSSVFDPGEASTAQHIEGLRRESIREIKEIPTLRFSWMGEMREVSATNVILSQTNHTVLRWLDSDKQWKWIPERDDNSARQPAGSPAR